ncbi:hypothetical protein FJNA_24410 [Thermus sp. FJN-A]
MGGSQKVLPLLRRELACVQGPQVAAAVLALLPRHLWGRAKAAASYAGLIPEREESGKSLARSRLSRKGPPLLRRKLYMGALVAVRHDPGMRAVYKRLLSRGKRKKQALLAVAHKLLRDDGKAQGLLRHSAKPTGCLTRKAASKLRV